jgi:SDR family mycofactocin-dependent oxidoreductase
MPGRLEGKVAFITGAARGQGRSHAVRLAQEGADVIAIDLCEDIETIPAPLSRAEDLAETVKQVEALDRRIISSIADVRDFDGLSTAVEAGVEELGRLDIVSAGAGLISYAPALETSAQQWQEMLDTTLTGVWHTAKAAAPHIIAGGRGGSITITSSAVTARTPANIISYVAAKNGLIGVMQALATELAPHWIRVNTIHPATARTPMVFNKPSYKLFLPDLEDPTAEDFEQVFEGMNLLPVGLIEAIDVSNALLFLASDEARYITGVQLPVDAGWTIKA